MGNLANVQEIDLSTQKEEPSQITLTSKVDRAGYPAAGAVPTRNKNGCYEKH